MTRHTWVVTWPTPQSVRDMTTPVIDVEGLRRLIVADLDNPPKIVVGQYPDRDQQAHMGVEFD